MNHDEFAFFNQQLATMLREDVPLEGALKQLCSGMRRGVLRTELERLEADLENGRSLKEALADRQLPELYVRMLQAGSESNDLPGILVLLADHYHRTYSVWTRLKGLMVYPFLLLLAVFGFSVLLAAAYMPLARTLLGAYAGLYSWNPGSSGLPESLSTINVWLLSPPCFFGSLLVVLIATVTIPALRRRTLWLMPAFKEANLARFASLVELSLKGGCTLREAFAIARSLEGTSPLGQELSSWEKRLSAGKKRLREIGERSKVVPPLFLWLVDSCGEDWQRGFQQARQIYSARAVARTEMFLYAALPVSILMLGVMICGQLVPMARLFIGAMSWLG